MPLGGVENVLLVSLEDVYAHRDLGEGPRLSVGILEGGFPVYHVPVLVPV